MYSKDTDVPAILEEWTNEITDGQVGAKGHKSHFNHQSTVTLL